MEGLLINESQSTPTNRATHPVSFFERLPYDVRASIYSYIEAGDLPPITRGFQPSASGFLISCRSAKQDLEEIAARSLGKFLREFKSTFENTTDCTIQISDFPESSTLAELRSLRITLPFTSFCPIKSSDWKYVWKREVLAGLHPLLRLYSDKIHLHFSGPDNMPACKSLLDRGRVEVSMHSILRKIAIMLESLNRWKTGTDSMAGILSVERIFKYEVGRQRDTWINARVNAKRICLSWDLRDNVLEENGQTITLNGKLHRIQVPVIENGSEKKDAAIFYHLRDEQRLVGEMGVVSDGRWELREDIDRLLNGVSTHWVYCSSSGLGKALGEGLVGCAEAKFEEDEQEVSGHIYH
ncbi:uncharacterized protein K460DRAFT_99666 [Cucurbitaria berberidis CBS 394.84]|uniref:Uncharacterized protein n=1 Tax=Cucurbitaria berberidis CBS 394.84 TaxID=1168544 RepID=A0A9P4L841_9PLEO|nr:uncharacterized protein K460DRAFT_99666 [Cucurbitaria berberidis CBS 394.84]KAF1844853.1 hypothetical protein K460DRAFT_99666 [Cucurbitaria berberidis CBS 394.84]